MKEKFRSFILMLLTLEARAVLKRHKPRVVVVTGSVGKTSTKDAAFSVFKDNVFVRKSEKSYNSDIGVPLTILGVPNGWSNIAVWVQNLLKGLMLLLTSTPYPKWLIIEVGADRPGDISKSLAWVRPNIVVTTRFPDVPVHVEFYESPEAVIAEELFPLSLLGQGGTAIMNADDVHSKDAPIPENVARITYGFGRTADMRAMRYRPTSQRGLLSGISFDIVHKEEKVHVTLPGVIGTTQVYALLAGIASALAVGITLEQATKNIENHLPPPGRLRLIPGVKSSMIIDDTYNSSPAAVEEALEALKSAPEGGKRIAVLGDMLELGTYSVSEHARMGAYAAASADILVTVGVRAKEMAKAAREVGMSESRVQEFERAADAITFLTSFLDTGDTVLIKGSQGMRMERIVKALMAEPEKAPELLVRQDAEWLSRI